MKYFKIDLFNEEFYNKFNENKIYSLFSKNYENYLKGFSTNITEVKYFGLFFKILPKKEYDENSIIFIIKWLKKYKNTLDDEKCKNFKEEICT